MFFFFVDHFHISIESIDPVLNHLYKNMNETIEKWTKIVYAFLIKILVPSAAALDMTMAYYIHFTSDSTVETLTFPKYMK